MPDLDRLLDTLVTDVTAGTRPPGASAAIKQAHGRRVRVVAAAAVAAVAFIGVGGGLAAGILSDSDRISPVEPTLPSPEPPTAQESTEPSPGSDEYFEVELRKILTQVPDWAVTNADPTILHPCGGDWSESATGGGGGNFGIRTPGEPPSVWHDAVGFPSADKASGAVSVLVENLESCTAVVWRTQPIPQTRAVLASSADGVIWIDEKGDLVSTLQVPTTDGPPPVDVQIEVAELMVDDMIHKQKD
jgi:hypothetical protein